MGCVSTITADTFPAQGDWVGKEVELCFHYKTSETVKGVIVRDDLDAPGETLIKITTGLHTDKIVRGAECQFSPRTMTSKKD